jgi:hypothetical protein
MQLQPEGFACVIRDTLGDERHHTHHQLSRCFVTGSVRASSCWQVYVGLGVGYQFCSL